MRVIVYIVARCDAKQRLLATTLLISGSLKWHTPRIGRGREVHCMANSTGGSR